jgi:D-psicose/D-tagatose/L-ribulose 3-epimerase
MIKYGVHCYIFTDCWSNESLHILDSARELGANVLEIAIGDDVHFTPGLTRRKAEELGLALTTGPGGDWPLECDLSSDDPEERQRGLAWHKRQVDVTAELGAIAYTGAIYGHPGVVKRRIPPPDEYQRIAEALHQLATYAEQRGVKIALEPMSHFRTHVVNTPDQMMQLITLADHQNLWILLDTYHLVTEIRDYAQAIRTVRDRLWGIHACENDRGVPGGGLVPWKTIFAALREIGFDGYMLLETYNSSLGDFAYKRGIFLNVCPDAVTFVREGLTFLRQQGL